MRLIDADALREKMYHEAFEKDSAMQKWDSGCWIRYKMFENAIDDSPTVEPELNDLGCVLYCLGEKIPSCCDGYCKVCRYSVRGIHFIKNGKVYYLDDVYHCRICERRGE